jgi:PKD repeat protein
MMLSGCHGGSSVGPGARDGGSDAVAAGDAVEPQALDFTLTGCGRYDASAGRCYGAPPLTLSFSPIGSAALTRFLWDFGDGTPPSTDRAPSHSYALPGSYQVTVTGAGSVGTVQSRAQTVSVSAVLAGSACDVGAQCATGLTCVCGVGSGCPSAFLHGICTAACPSGSCGAGAACVAFEPPAAPSDGGASSGDGGGGGGDPLAQPLCLATCQQDADCAAGLACRDVRAGGTATGSPSQWTRACIPASFLGDLGQPCRTAAGALDDAACLSGTCADLGALGLCSASCANGATCPPGSTCALLGDGRALCLEPCSGAGACARDPLLDCETPGTAGPLGFTVPGAEASASYCAPMRCSADGACGPAGACDSGHCVSR